jgi:hypothetical protein
MCAGSPGATLNNPRHDAAHFLVRPRQCAGGAGAVHRHGPVTAEPQLIQPFLDLFDRLFVWLPGEYIIELTVETSPGSASFGRKYRFTLYESDSAELRSHKDDYPFGGGLSYNVDRHVGVFVPITQHGG